MVEGPQAADGCEDIYELHKSQARFACLGFKAMDAYPAHTRSHTHEETLMCANLQALVCTYSQVHVCLRVAEACSRMQ